MHESHININDNENVRYFNHKHELQTIAFGDLKEIAIKQFNEKGRNLVRVKVSGDKISSLKQTPTFRILLQNELEELVRKNRQHKKQQFFEVIPPSSFITSELKEEQTVSSDINTNDLTTKTKRIRQKQLRLKVGIGDHDLQAAVKCINKWLSSGTIFVTVNITSNDKNVEGKKMLETSLRSKLENAEGLQNLTFKME